MPQKPTPAPSSLLLEGDLDVFAIHDQWDRARLLLNTPGSRAELDLSGIGDLDLSGIQLLSALRKALRDRGIRLEVKGLQEDWKDRFSPLGLAHVFDGEAP
jgi:ABC-type transporter Mla MlaB component